MEDFKVHMFYLKNEEDASIYSYTTDKELCKLFKQTRDMSKFIYKTNRLSPLQLRVFEEKHSDKKLVKEFQFTKFTDTCNFEFVYTMHELICISDTGDEYIHELLWKSVETSPYIFKDKYYEALKSIFYVNCHNYLKEGYLPEELFEIDYMGILIDLYGHLLNGGDK